MFRAGLYARVATNDQQTLAMQSRAMREHAARRGWTISLQVREVGSGAARREARGRISDAARRREIDVVLVWRLDRWGRACQNGDIQCVARDEVINNLIDGAIQEAVGR